MSNQLIDYTPVYSTDSGTGSERGTNEMLENNIDGIKSTFNVLIREHIQNSLDAFDKREDKPEKLIFKVSRKYIDYEFAKLDNLKTIFQDCINYKKRQIPEDKQKYNNALLRLERAHDNLESRLSNNFWSIVIEDNGCGLTGETRFDVDNVSKKFTSKLILDEGDTDKYENSQRGAYGIGKLSAFRSTDTYTVFYLNSNSNNRRFFIGKTQLESYSNSQNLNCGPNIYFGKVENKFNDKVSDWLDVTDLQDISDLRTIEGPGLTTIIPSFLKVDNKDWAGEVAYAVIHSYFRLFEADKIEVIIEDEANNQKLVINKNNYRQQYMDAESLEYIFNGELIDKYHYHLVRPFVVEESHYKHTIHEISLNVTKEYSGTAKIHFYKNDKLDEIIQEMNNSESKRTFRFIRKDMLLRAYLIPGQSLFDTSFCGFVEFTDENNDALNSILRLAETKSHDNLDLTKLQTNTIENFPSYNTIKQRFIGEINKFIKDKVFEMSDNYSVDGEEIEVELDLLSGFSEKNSTPSFYRSILSQETINKHLKNVPGGRISNLPGDGGPDVSSPIDDDPQNPSSAMIIPGGVTGDGIRVNPGGSTSTIPNTGSMGKDHKGRTGKDFSKISYLTKIISKADKIHTYAIKIEDVNQCFDLSIQQDKKLSNSSLSFELRKIIVNGVERCDYSFVRGSNMLLKSYEVKNIEPLGGVVIIEMTVIEPSKTESRFNLMFS